MPRKSATATKEPEERGIARLNTAREHAIAKAAAFCLTVHSNRSSDPIRLTDLARQATEHAGLRVTVTNIRMLEGLVNRNVRQMARKVIEPSGAQSKRAYRLVDAKQPSAFVSRQCLTDARASDSYLTRLIDRIGDSEKPADVELRTLARSARNSLRNVDSETILRIEEEALKERLP